MKDCKRDSSLLKWCTFGASAYYSIVIDSWFCILRRKFSPPMTVVEDTRSLHLPSIITRRMQTIIVLSRFHSLFRILSYTILVFIKPTCFHPQPWPAPRQFRFSSNNKTAVTSKLCISDKTPSKLVKAPVGT